MHTSRNAPASVLAYKMATKGPYDEATFSPWTTKTTYKAPKAMSLQAFKVRKMPLVP
jgi:hypothetical protein